MSSYHKFTIISGYDAAKQFQVLSRPGHWKAESVKSAATKAGITGQVEFKHHTGDTSGHGRGGIDRRFVIHPDGAVTALAAW